MDLEVASADRRLHPVAVPAHIGERTRDRRLARAEEAEHASTRRSRACRAPPAAARSPRARRPEPAQLAAAVQGARRTRTGRPPRRDRAPCLRRRSRRRPRGSSPASSPLRRSPRTAGSADRRSSARRPRSRASRSSSTPSCLPETRATSSTVRSSWVGPSPPETRHTSASLARPEGGLEVVGIVADDDDALRSRGRERAPHVRRTGRCGPSRSPRTSSLPVTTIAALGRLTRPG